MNEEYSFPPYVERMQELLKVFGGTRLAEYRGYDVRPLWDQKGDGYTGFKYLYQAPKIDKIALGFGSFREKLMSYALVIWPDDSHALPIFSNYWAESAKGSFFLIDFYPLADCIRDIPYMEKYLEPLEDPYGTGLDYFPGLGGRSANWFRALVSPYCLTGDIDASKENQDRILGLIEAYLKIWTELWKKDEPRTPEEMKEYNARKEAIRMTFREKDSIGDMMLSRAIGKELAHLSLIAQF
jgi:hypothetical protein